MMAGQRCKPDDQYRPGVLRGLLARASMSFALQAVLAAMIFATGAGAGVKWHVGIVASRTLAAQNEAFRKTELRSSAIDTAAVKHEQFKTRVELREIEILKEVDRVVEKPVYSNVCVDDDGLRIIAADIAARHAASQPAPTVPAPTGAFKNRWQNHTNLDPRSDPPL